MKNSTKLKKQKLLQAKFPVNPAPSADLATINKTLHAMRDLQALQQLGKVPAAQNEPVERFVEVVPASITKGLVAIANSYFRAKKKMLDPTTGEPHEAMSRVYKDIERISRHLEEMGFKIQNHTGDAYDDGQPMKVITSNPRPEATRKYVLETLLPTIYWNDKIIQHGEIEIAVPSAPATKQ
jgi:hypothetical protein